jgi:hypothetical protein
LVLEDTLQPEQGNKVSRPGVNPAKLLISSFFQFSFLSLAISKYRQYFLMLQTLKLNNKKWKKSSFYEEKSLVGLTPGYVDMIYLRIKNVANVKILLNIAPQNSLKKQRCIS